MNDHRGVESWKEHTDSFDRVQSIARCLSQPRPVSYIADQARVTEATAQEHLEQLAKIGVLIKSKRDGELLYDPDPLYTRFWTLRQLIEKYDQEQLLELKADLQQRIEGLEEKYEGRSPSDLRDNPGDTEAADEIPQPIQDASDWELMEYHLSIVEEAIDIDTHTY